jgi:predicted Ser/Thr protein kinase
MTTTTAIQSVPDTLTAGDITQALPRGVSLNVSPDLVNHINGLMQDEQLQLSFRDNLLSYTSVLKEGKFKADSYVAAVHYTSLKLMGETNESAYSKVHPDRYNKLILANKSPKDISAHVSAYHKSKLVGLIMAQTLTPVWVYNQSAVQEAINTQVCVMRDPKAGHMAKVQAANSILTHLKQPETAKVELDIAVSETNALDELKSAMKQFAEEQQAAIDSGASDVGEIAGKRIAPKSTDIVQPMP